MGQTHCREGRYHHDYRFGPPTWEQPHYHHDGGPHFANDFHFRPSFGFGNHHNHHNGGFGGGQHHHH
ncbi:hypothetical protein I4U23_005064 [Adineta vaga]|nr:hypothetical protein I4U23_005064 [Adineta vaga]